GFSFWGQRLTFDIPRCACPDGRMSRPLRIQYPNAHYHVVARGNERRKIFWDEKDFEKALKPGTQ
nr:hypothetical protein [bacterium]